ncbi:MAG: hypothetical protein C0613_14520 [Desulfobulbaceae bacterium]|nr:MAG: hypothetical protein C0613_14520 [Desulfobulbaceae bacterium]
MPTIASWICCLIVIIRWCFCDREPIYPSKPDDCIAAMADKIMMACRQLSVKIGGTGAKE